MYTLLLPPGLNPVAVDKYSNNFTSLISSLALISSCLENINYGSFSKDGLWILSSSKGISNLRVEKQY